MLSKTRSVEASIKDFDSQKPTKRLVYIVHEEMDRIASVRLGRVLTIIDASIPDQEQRKAIKDLINTSYWQGDLFADIRRMLLEFDQEFVTDHLEVKDAEDMEILDTPKIGINEYRSYFGKK
jgi:hypothetical protein